MFRIRRSFDKKELISARSWLQENIGSILVVLILLTVTALIVRRLIPDKKAGMLAAAPAEAAAAAAPCRADATANKPEAAAGFFAGCS